MLKILQVVVCRLVIELELNYIVNRNVNDYVYI
jgi:hypothetical protein